MVEDQQSKNRKRQLTQKEKKLCLELYDGKCDNCSINLELGKDYIEFDHIIPYSMGGESTIENERPICRNCKTLINKKDIKNLARLRRLEKPEKTKRPMNTINTWDNKPNKLNTRSKMKKYNKFSKKKSD